MQTIYGDASNIYLTAQKRLIRPVYGQTQATPYAAYLDENLFNAEGAFVVPASTATKPIKRSAAVETYRESVMPATVLVRTKEEQVAPASGQEFETPFGLLAQWVGGQFDNLKGTREVAAWYGPDSVFDILYPGFEKGTISTLLKEYTESLEKGEEPDEKRVFAVASTKGLLSGKKRSEILSTKNEKQYKYPPVGEIISLSGNVLRLRLLV